MPIKDGSGNSYRYRIKEKETPGYHTEYQPVTTAGSSSAPVYTQVIINDKIEINKKIDALKDNKPENSFKRAAHSYRCPARGQAPAAGLRQERHHRNGYA